MAQPCAFLSFLIESLCWAACLRPALAGRYNHGMKPLSSPSILVVDDDPVIVELVAETLTSSGMDATTCTDGLAALELLRAGSFDLVILDIMMPGASGLEVCARIRATSAVPVIFLSAKDEESDKVVGLMTGADDYIVKPFLPRELVARVYSCLRRAAYARTPTSPQVLACRGLELDAAAHVARLHGEALTLTPKEFAVLEELLKAGGRPVGTKELFETVWGERYLPGSANSVMVHIRHLRTKLAAIDSEQVFIETVWGVGYKIAP